MEAVLKKEVSAVGCHFRLIGSARWFIQHFGLNLV
jgi:hypothetical protein